MTQNPSKGMALSLILLFITLFTSCLANPTSTPPSSTLTTTTTTTTTTTNSGTTTIITSEASATSGPCIDIQPIVGDCTGNLGQSLCPAWILRGECLLSCGACTPNPRIPTPVIDIFPPLPPSPPTTPTKSPTTIPPIKSSTGRRPPFSSSSSTGRGTGTGTGNGNGNGNDMSITNTNVTCFDVVPPPQPYTPPLTCAQYVQAGACATLQGFCRLSCGNCTIPTLSPATITMNTIMGSNESTAALVVRVIGITALIAIVIVVFLAWVSHRRAVRRVMSRVQGKHHAFTDLIQQRSQTNLLHENGAYVSSSLTPPPRADHVVHIRP